MASLNTTRKPQLPPQGGFAPPRFEESNTHRTHEGAPAAYINPELALRRSVCSCLLWEKEFYEDGEDIATRITNLVHQVPLNVAADLAVDVRSHFNLRHVPLLIAAAICGGKHNSREVGDTIANVIQRADELSEFLAVYAKVNGVKPGNMKKKLSVQARRGIAMAFRKFDEYQLSKYDRHGPIRLRDALFLSHAKPVDDAQAALWAKLVDNTLPSPDTWEVALSAGADKKETFTRLITEKKIGYLALLRNLRNMAEAGVDETLVREAILERRGAHRVLPFRYTAAARAVPNMSMALNQALLACIKELPVLPGRTVVLVDVSGSMDAPLSSKSDLTRMDAAATLAAVIHGDVAAYSFSEGLAGPIQSEGGLNAVTAIINSQRHSSTYLGQAVSQLDTYADEGPGVIERSTTERLIVITDEQSHDHVAPPRNFERCYMINVASAKHGVGYGEGWTHIDGFSEQVIRFIHEFEGLT